MSAPILLGLRILMMIALYAFVGWGLYLMWRALKSQIDLIHAPGIPPISIKVQSEFGQYLLQIADQTDIAIGRDKNCLLCLDDPAISLHHACLTYHHKQWWVEDLGSTNGTFINEESLKTPVILVHGDVVRCGNSQFLIYFENSPLESNPKQEIE